MNGRLSIVLTVASIVAFALLTTGCPGDDDEMYVCCNTARGGGSLSISDGPGKSHQATFGFQLVCEQPDPAAPRKVSGQFEYHDHGAKDAKGKPMRVSIHGVAQDAGEAPGQCSDNTAMFKGPYRAQPEIPGYGEGTFTVTVVDNGKRGASDGDTFRLVLSGGRFDGYTAEGTLAGGNITASDDTNKQK